MTHPETDCSWVSFFLRPVWTLIQVENADFNVELSQQELQILV
jgi:hypothetical protein